MKAILYMGAVLMTGAVIYGFVDYRQASRSKDFNKLYEQTETTEPVVSIPDTKTVVVPEKKNSEMKKVRVAVKRSGLNNNKEKKLSQGSKRDVIPVTPLVTEKTEESLSVLRDEKTDSALKEIQKKKRLNIRMYSRAALKVEPTQKKKKIIKD